MSYTTIKIEHKDRYEKNDTFLDFEGLIHEDKLDILIWLDCNCACTVRSFTS